MDEDEKKKWSIWTKLEESQEMRLSHRKPTGGELKKAELFLNKFHFEFEKKIEDGKYSVLFHILPRIRRLFDISRPIIAFLYKLWLIWHKKRFQDVKRC